MTVYVIKPHKYSSGCQNSSFLKFESVLFKAEQENMEKSLSSETLKEREKMESIRWKCGIFFCCGGFFFPLNTAEFSSLNR